MTRLKREATRQGKTMSELVVMALRLLVQSRPRAADLPPLPSFRGGAELVDITDRDALCDALEGR